MKDLFKRYIEVNSRKIIIFISIILIAILVGIGSYNLLNIESKANLYELTTGFLDTIKGESFASIDIFCNSIKNNIITVLLIFIASITIISFPIITGILFLKGMSIGFFIAIIFSIFGVYKGMLYSFLLVFLPNLLYIPIFVIISITAGCFSENITNMSRLDRKWIDIFKHFLKMSCVTLLLIIPIILESYIIKIFIFTYLKLG